MSNAQGELKGRLEVWDIKDIIPYADNANSHPQEQIEKLAAQIARDGWDQPIVVDKDGVIIKGHARRLAALHLGIAQVPTLVRDDMTPKQVKAARLGDHGISALAHLDVDALSREVTAMMSMQDDMTISIEDMGFRIEDLVMVGDTAPIFASTPIDDATPAASNEPAAPANDNSKPNLDHEKPYVELRQIIVDAKNEDEQKRIYDMVTAAGFTCRPLTI